MHSSGTEAVVPLKAILLNLLWVGTAYGLTVAVCQKGWRHQLVPAACAALAARPAG
ncbi:MAG: hypothetical protein M3121_04715 [Chloroflexota bacterium]|nr:hypothetical protein [Chloroflexota bacterium]